MGIAKPIAIYIAKDNIELQLLCDHLERNGIESYTTADGSVGLWELSFPQIHAPKLWVDKSQVNAARALLEVYDRDHLRRQAKVGSGDSNASVQVVCEDCGKSTQFPESQRGTVQDCSHCGSFVDVGDGVSDDWDVGSESDMNPDAESES